MYCAFVFSIYSCIYVGTSKMFLSSAQSRGVSARSCLLAPCVSSKEFVFSAQTLQLVAVVICTLLFQVMKLQQMISCRLLFGLRYCYRSLPPFKQFWNLFKESTFGVHFIQRMRMPTSKQERDIIYAS